MHLFNNTFSTIGFWGAEIQRVLFFIIPAFSSAINSKVLPKKSIWSIEILVIIVKSGLFITLVASKRPPKPVSIIATSALVLDINKKAIHVNISNWVIGSPLLTSTQ